MLEDLDRDEIVEGRRDLEGAKLRAGEPRRQRGAAGNELSERLARDVEPVQVEPGVDQRQVVAPIASADVEADVGQRGGVGPQRGEDPIDERQRRLRVVAARAVLGVPAGRDELAAQASPFSRIDFSSHSQI